MNAKRPRSARTSHVFLTLALLALVMRVMVPTGFMMGQAASGVFTIVICSPDGERTSTVALPDGGSSKKPAQTDKHDSPCVFAGHGLADAPALAVLPAPVQRVQPILVAAVIRDVAPGRGLAAPPPPPTGPPISLI